MTQPTLQSIAQTHLEFKQRYATVNRSGGVVTTPEFFFLPSPVWRDMRRAGIDFNDVLDFDKIKARLTGRHVGLVCLLNSLPALKHMLASVAPTILEDSELMCSVGQEWAEYTTRPEVTLHYSATTGAQELDSMMFAGTPSGSGVDEPDFSIQQLGRYHMIVIVAAGFFDKALPEADLRQRRIDLRRAMLLQLAQSHGFQTAMACSLFPGYLKNLAALAAR